MVKQVVRLCGWLACSGILAAQTCTKASKHLAKQVATCSSMEDKVSKAKEEAIWGMFVADALAMPVHWYYNPADIKRGYGGWLQGYKAPNSRHPSSILTISATDGSGRSGWHSKSEPIIGSIILHDKLKYWTSRDRSTHYHQGMSAGDNTLNALTAMQALKVMQEIDPDATMEAKQLRAAVMENYVKFMTTPGSHGDTYAESFHRLFFREWREEEPLPTKGQDILKFCAKRYEEVTKTGQEDSQIPSIGSFVIAIPWIVHYASRPAEECANLASEAVKLTHPAPSLVPYVELYAKLLRAVIHGQELKLEALNTLGEQALGAGKRARVEKLAAESGRYELGSESRLEYYQDVTSMLGSACYINGAMSSMLFLAQEFHENFEQGVLTNANCGGENAHRGAALGALLGASSVHRGQPIGKKWKQGLQAQEAIQKVVPHLGPDL